MNSICIVDDDSSIVNILKDIITDHFDDVTIYTAQSGAEAIETINEHRPDILLLDYLMPDYDGLQVLRNIKPESRPLVIMISEVSDKQMIGKAYDEKISFFITKPINVIEVVSVLKKVMEHYNLRVAFSQFESVIKGIKKPEVVKSRGKNDVQKLKSLYSKLGLSGTSGYDDLIQAVIWAKNQNDDYTLMELYMALLEDEEDQNLYALKKRIRRIVTKAFKSMAALGIEDNLNPVYDEYALQLFDYGELRKEMQYQQGLGKDQGKINIKQFIESSIVLIQEMQ
ncbi:two-component system, response regulator YcbB [Dethiosulfatibacter aminovorans DSM 17477]|uniref:Two-component system, response regulator YcbB n=1 Tax=Dethiosulfatibacter aminovorans DSM 17477 TaxID=1121476 RepID=A0A1M6EMA9_9FIRM|nr:DNA-binding domain-containing protein [Dethiosulfatibacter aminovorans]SHI86519.1 two-component system, response regulator YcbB [Dethiosulfatibacter aminovorans DSM 17477]